MSSPPLDPADRLQAMRQSYLLGGLDEEALAGSWLEQFLRWMQEAEAAGIREPNAMVLATAGAGAQPTARTVLLKAVDERGLVFFTNHNSRKGRDLAENPRASLLFPWIDLQRQVIACGSLDKVGEGESDAYFATRPREAQLSAVASPQSEVIGDRGELERRRASVAESFPEGTAVPRPGHWGGVRLVPETVEFWQGRPGRLHDRLRFRRDGEAWVVERLAP